MRMFVLDAELFRFEIMAFTLKAHTWRQRCQSSVSGPLERPARVRMRIEYCS
jgi:hypothetical protein